MKISVHDKKSAIDLASLLRFAYIFIAPVP